MVEGIQCKQSAVMSGGVALGSVVGPLLFLIYYISNIDHRIQYCNTALFADDTRLLGVVRSEDDCTRMQDDIRTILSWAEGNSMEFNSFNIQLGRRK